MTSLYVYELLRHTLGWQLKQIIPQVRAPRGPVDYTLNAKHLRSKGIEIFVEVKAYTDPLGYAAIKSLKKYLVRKRRSPHIRYQIGVLTNFREWKFYLSFFGIGKLKVADNVIKSADISLTGLKDIRQLNTLLSQHGTACAHIRRRCASDPYFIEALMLKRAGATQQAVKRSIRRFSKKAPQQYHGLTELLDRYFRDDLKAADIGKKQIRSTLRSRRVLAALTSEADFYLGVARTRRHVKRGLYDVLGRKWRSQPA